jgi:CheY-like chemotaxis protein
MEGYEVRVAKDGFAALAQMRGALPDLILTDLKMPNMSGSNFSQSSAGDSLKSQQLP